MVLPEAALLFWLKQEEHITPHQGEDLEDITLLKKGEDHSEEGDNPSFLIKDIMEASAFTSYTSAD